VPIYNDRGIKKRTLGEGSEQKERREKGFGWHPEHWSSDFKMPGSRDG